MQTVKATLIILICIVLLGACGNKGPLYLPEPAEQSTATGADEKEENKDKKKSAHL